MMMHLPGSPASLSLVELARLRQAAYRLFGALFLYPDADRLARLRAAAEELEQEHIPWEAFSFSEPLRPLLAVLSGLSEEAAGQVEEDYVRLFQARSAAPPYESYYLDPEGQARAWIVTQVEQQYTEAGLALSSSLMDLPDHVAVELEFMSFLCAGEVRAWEAEAEQDGSQAQERQRAFLGQHLGRWFPRFAKRVQATTPEGLYAMVVEAAYAFLRYDLGLLRLRQNGAGNHKAIPRSTI